MVVMVLYLHRLCGSTSILGQETVYVVGCTIGHPISMSWRYHIQPPADGCLSPLTRPLLCSLMQLLATLVNKEP